MSNPSYGTVMQTLRYLTEQARLYRMAGNDAYEKAVVLLADAEPGTRRMSEDEDARETTHRNAQATVDAVNASTSLAASMKRTAK